jgi:hypothetical protein
MEEKNELVFPIKTWLWQVNCELCGYKSRWFKIQWIAKVVAIAHASLNHPYGYSKIEAKEE